MPGGMDDMGGLGIHKMIHILIVRFSNFSKHIVKTFRNKSNLIPYTGGLFQDPELLAAFQDPEVAAAFQDISTNPANMAKYQNNPKVMKLINQMMGKFGGGGAPGGMPGMPGMGGGMPGMGGGMPGMGGFPGMGGMPGGFPGGSSAPPPTSGGTKSAQPPPSSTDDLD